MFLKTEVKPLPGFQVVVNGQLRDSQGRIMVRKHDRVFYVSFAPHFTSMTVEASCQEGVLHTVKLGLRVELPQDHLDKVLQDAGHSTYRNVVQVGAAQLMARQDLPQLIEACVRMYASATEFFDLVDRERVRAGLQTQIHAECQKARLLGEVVSCDVVPVIPEHDLLSVLMAKAGTKQEIHDGVVSRRHTDGKLGRIVDYFLEAIRQREMVQAEVELVKTEAESARVEAQKQLAVARNNLKLAEMNEGERVAQQEHGLKQEDARRQEALKQINAALLEKSASYEFAYKQARLEEEMKLTAKQGEIARAKLENEVSLSQKQNEITKAKLEGEMMLLDQRGQIAQAALDQDVQSAHKQEEVVKAKAPVEALQREQRRLDMEVDLCRERDEAKIRGEEKAAAAATLTNVIDALAKISPPSYQGVHTLVSVGGDPDAKDPMRALLLSLVSQLTAWLSPSATLADGKQQPD